MKIFDSNRLSELFKESQNSQSENYYVTFCARAREEFEDCDTLDKCYSESLIKLGFPKEFATVEYNGDMLISKDDILNAFNGNARYVGELSTGETIDEPVYLHNLKNDLGFKVGIWMTYNGNDYLVPSLVDKISPLHAILLIVSRELEAGHLKFQTNDINPQC